MKVADLLATDGNLLSILQRLDIKLGFGEATVADLCNKYGISTELFLMICNIYTFSDYQPKVESLGSSDIKNITAYLRSSHRWYTGVCFPAIHNNVHNMVKELDEVSRKLIDKFYDDYDSEITRHFRYEEDTVFPYIDSLLTDSSNDRGKYSIHQFEENHRNISEKLNDLKNIIAKYLGEEYSSPQRYSVLADIYTIESDLRKHSLIEYRLLIPLVEKLENRHE
jgi:regulator of cell morphogenesis and NO signaling